MNDTDQKLAAIAASIARIERVIELMLVKRPTVAEQAKKAGVSRVTHWRRRQREKFSQMVNGGTRRKPLSP